jgi:hypothetical protein
VLNWNQGTRSNIGQINVVWAVELQAYAMNYNCWVLESDSNRQNTGQSNLQWNCSVSLSIT